VCVCVCIWGFRQKTEEFYIRPVAFFATRRAQPRVTYSTYAHYIRLRVVTRTRHDHKTQKTGGGARVAKPCTCRVLPASDGIRRGISTQLRYVCVIRAYGLEDGRAAVAAVAAVAAAVCARGVGD